MEYLAAFKRPFGDWRKLLIGVVVFSMTDFFAYLHANLIFIGFLIVLIGYGYLYEAAEYVIKKDLQLPEWKDIGNLFKQGVLLFLVFLLYTLPGLLVLWQTGSFQQLAGQNVETASWGLLIGVILAFLGLYLYPFSLFNYIVKKEYNKLIEFKVIFRKAFTGAYFFAFIIALIYTVIIQSIALQINSYVGIWVLKALVYGAAVYIILMTQVTLFAIAWTKVKSIGD